MAERDVLVQPETLHRVFGPTPAVQDLSFTLHRGEILGFMGANGAGKTTVAMAMRTGNLAPSGGRVVPNGHDLLDDPRDATASVGDPPAQRRRRRSQVVTARGGQVQPGAMRPPSRACPRRARRRPRRTGTGPHTWRRRRATGNAGPRRAAPAQGRRGITPPCLHRTPRARRRAPGCAYRIPYVLTFWMKGTSVRLVIMSES